MNNYKIFIVIGVIIITLLLIYVVVKTLENFLRKITRITHQTSSLISNTNDILETIKEADKIVATTPKTLSVVESVFIDDIKKDFPELNLDITKTYVQEIVTDFIEFCHTGDDIQLKKDCTENFIAQAKTFKDPGEIKDLKFHRTVIRNYKKSADNAILTFQTSCQYILNNVMVQKRFEVNYVYYLEETPESKTISLKCPYCGGPVEHVGEKICIYCGSKLIDTIKRTWKFDTIKEF